MHSIIRTFFLIAMLNLTLAVSGVAAEDPKQVVKGVIDGVLDILNNPAYKAPAQKSHRRQLIKQAVDRRFDYREMAKRCLGHTWRSLSPAQRDNFVRLFAELLEASYSDKIEKYTGQERIDYTGEIVEEDYAEVRTVVVRRNDRIPLNYRLLRESEGWRIYDVVIEGVSLVSNYRSQFHRIISESSYTELLRRLKNKVDELKRTGGA
jgi:phospholipid transport system substrate-binding protein